MAVGDAPSVGNSTNDFVTSSVDKANMGGGYDLGLGQSRLSRRLIEHYKRKGAKGGKIRCGEGEYEHFYLDTDSAGAVYRFGHELEGTVNDLGDAIDWMLRLSIRPTAKTSAANMANYALQSFFIEVSEHGYYDTLPQRLVAEGIQVSFELLVDVLSIEITGVDAEDALREGFEAVAKARKSGITEELINQMDNYFDIAVDAIRDAAKEGKISGGRITGDGLEGLSREFGKALAKKLKAASPERKQKMLEDPIEVFDFYNELLRESGQRFELTEDASLIHMRAKRDKLVALKEENARLRERDKDLVEENERLRKQKEKDLKEPRHGDEDLQSETKRTKEQREREKKEYRDTTQAGRDHKDLGDARRTWKQWALSWVGMGNR